MTTTSKKSSGQFALLVGTTLLLALSLLAGYMSQYEWSKRHWPSVPGKIVVTDIRESRDSDNDPQYTLYLAIVWKVAGQGYSRANISYFTSAHRSRVRFIEKTLKAQKFLPVYYPDDKPAAGTIFNFDSIFFIGGCYSCFTALFSAFMLFVFSRRVRNRLWREPQIDQSHDAVSAAFYFSWFSLTPIFFTYLLSYLFFQGTVTGLRPAHWILLICMLSMGLIVQLMFVVSYAKSVKAPDLKFFELPKFMLDTVD